MWETVELRELRVFLTLAEELHFGRTAERLRLTPSRVSQSVRGLEQKLGAQLAHRTSRRVQLTSFGELAVSELAPSYAQLTAGLESLTTAARSVEGTLRVGVLSGPAGGRRLLDVLGAFDALHPACEVDLVQLDWGDPLAQLRAGDVDLMVSWLPLEQSDLVVGPTLSSDSRVLAVAPHHPLAERDHVTVEELGDFKLAHFDGWPKELHEAWFPPKTPSGRPIPFTRVPAGERSALELATRVARGELVHPTVTSAERYLGPFELTFIPIRGLKPFRSALVWRRGVNDAKVRAFVRVARGVLSRKQKGRARMASFSGRLLGIGNNTGIEVPEDVVLAFDRGKRVPVTVTVNGYTYRSTIVSRRGRFLIPVSSAIRAETGLEADDPIDVTLELDDAPREVEVPAELAEALAADPVATEAWDKLSYSGKRQHTLAIDGAKAAETKVRRVAKTIATLRGDA